MPLQERPTDRSRNLRYGRGHIYEASRPPAARPAASVSAERQAHTAKRPPACAGPGLIRWTWPSQTTGDHDEIPHSTGFSHGGTPRVVLSTRSGGRSAG